MTKNKKKCCKGSVRKGNSVVTLEVRKFTHQIEKVKKKRSRGELQFCDLPREILERILGNINIWKWNGIRATCKHLKNICDTALVHEFKTDIQKYKQQVKSGYEFVALKVIHQATWPYIKAGYCPLFLGTMLSLIRNYFRYPFCLPVKSIKQFLLKFYKIVEESSGDPCSQTSRLLYVITLLGFVKKCKNAVLVTSNDDGCSNYCQLIYRLDGSWLGMLWSSTPSQVLSYLIDRNELLVILAEIMISVELESSFKKVRESENKIFVFGHEENRRARTPKTFLSFNMHGSPRILSLLKNVTSEEQWDYLPTDEFSLDLRILSKESNRWGCCDDYRLEIGPYCGDEDKPETCYSE